MTMKPRQISFIDLATTASVRIDYAHHKIHGGSAFYVMYSVADLGAMATPDDAITLNVTTPNTTHWGHFQFWATGSAGWRVRLTEAPTGGVATPTGQITILNKNRNSTTTSTFTDGSTANQVDYDSTLATGGVVLWDQYLEGAGGPKAAGTSGGTRDEMILDQGVEYQLSLYGAAAAPATIYMSWYENTSMGA